MFNKRVIALATAMTMMLSVGTVLNDNTSMAAENKENSISTRSDYTDNGERFGDYEAVDGYDVLLSAPSKYDSRSKGYITSVKDQGSHNTSWAFATLGAAESSLIKNNKVKKPNLSEYHLSYFTYHKAADILGLIAADTTSPSISYLNIGGDNYDGMFTLASWKGAANESKAPYGKATVKSVLSEKIAYEDSYHMQSADIVSVSKAQNVKSLIMKYGSVASSVAFDSKYFNSTTKAYYQDIYTFTNNAVDIIGWDDDYSIGNFASKKRPKNNGAWLVKNSWGGYMDYVWVSYEDTSICKADAIGYDMASKFNYDYIYQYDGTTNTSFTYVNNGDSVVNVFKAAGSSKQSLNAVSIATADDNVQYSLQIFKNPTAGNPISGETMLDAPVTGVITYAGYHTIKIPKEISLNRGDVFSVVFTLFDINDSTVKVFADTSGTKDVESAGSVIGKVTYRNTTDAGQSYIYNSRAAAYTDLHSKNESIRIKAFTKDYTVYDLAKAKVLVGDKTYTGKPVKPTVKVLLNGKTLKRGTDYTVKYSNNVNPGKGTVTVTGKGKYYGSSKKSFKIVKATTKYKGVDYSPVYDFVYYTDRHPELVKKYGYNDKKILEYFVTSGMKAGHQGNISFNPKYYAYRYADIRRKYKNNYKNYYIHYINIGKNEGKKGTYVKNMSDYATTYNGLDYTCVYNYNYFANQYPTVVKKYGLDDEAVLKYFVTTGMKKAYRGSKEFDPKVYKERYGDVSKKYGNNWEKYYLHYIKVGKKNGRIGY